MTIQDKLAGLRAQYLERDDESDPGGRIYRDKSTGEIFHSCTRILSATAPEAQKKALERWQQQPGAIRLETKPHIVAPQPTTMLNTSSNISTAGTINR